MATNEKIAGSTSNTVVSDSTEGDRITASQDEALKVLHKEHGSDDWDKREERALLWKIDRKLFSLILISFALQYYDKTMISQAAIFGLRTDLKLVGYDYTLSASLLYVGFLAGAYPSALLAQKFPTERVMGILVLIWGLCMTLTITCTNFAGLATQRTFLGLLEGGVSPIAMLVIGSWYTKCT
jgi:MFS family permease